MFLQMFVLVKELSGEQRDDIRNEISIKAGRVYPPRFHIYARKTLLYFCIKLE